MGLRILLGFMLIFSGINKLFGFMPMPEMSDKGTAFMVALESTKYMIPVIGLIEVIGGVLLATNKAVSLLAVVIQLLPNIFIIDKFPPSIYFLMAPPTFVFIKFNFVCKLL